MEDIIAGSSEAIDNNLNQALAFTTSTMAKVSPNLLRRRRSPSPSTPSVTPNTTQKDSLLATSSSGGGNTSSSSGVSTGNRSDRYLSPGGGGGAGGGGGGSDQEGKEKSLSDASSASQKSSSDPSQLLVPGIEAGSAGALSKSPSTGSDIVCGAAKSKGKIPNQAKKKSWYSVFYPSYKSRSADFKKLFKDVPDEERLLVGEELIVSRLCLFMVFSLEIKYL